MSEWIWINGKTMPLAEAKISVEDRGFQFADGIYEVIRLYDGRPFCLKDHLDRLVESAKGIRLEIPLSMAQLSQEIARSLEGDAARLSSTLRLRPDGSSPKSADGIIYLQLTRGASPRNHLFPDPKAAPPTLLFYRRALPAPRTPASAMPGIKLHSVDDFRWKRCWIKSIALLPNVLAKNTAIAAGADEAIFINDGAVTECAASNFLAVVGGRVVAHPVGEKVLPGITMKVLRQVAAESGIAWEDRPLPVEAAKKAEEIFITSTTREINWVSHWDGQSVGGGRCGAVTQALHKGLLHKVAQETAPASSHS
jgi:D-alanine transaminase